MKPTALLPFAAVATLVASVVQAQTVLPPRAAALRSEIESLNQRIESRVDQAVGVLSGVTDSSESRLTVSHVKGDAIKGLRNNLDALRSKREMLRDQALRYAGPAAVELQAEVARLDRRIGKRIDQLIQLACSLDQSEEIARYQARFDDWDISTRENEAWRQNRISSNFASGERKEIITGLQSAIANLESESKKIRTLIPRAPSPRQQALLEADAERIDGLLAQRRLQLQHVLTASGPRRALDRTSANELRKLYEKLEAELAADTRSLMRKYSDYVTAVTAAAK